MGSILSASLAPGEMNFPRLVTHKCDWELGRNGQEWCIKSEDVLGHDCLDNDRLATDQAPMLVILVHAG